MIRARTRGRMAGFFLAAAIFLFSQAPLGAQIAPAPGTGPGLAESVEAIESARVTTRILYVTAHPDDESAAVLTYLARGLHADVALLSLTRGEGGQNALGPEQAPQLGLIRTQELLAAARGYGVKLFFTRAKDFGYSKTPEETMSVWGDQATDDMVRVMRTFRPHIVINNWGGVHGGHGHHQAAGLLTPKAVQMAADPKAFPAQLQEGLHPWGDAQPVQILDLERDSGNPKGYVLPLDEISPLWGKSWREIGLDAFVNHRTQGIAGFLNSAFLRRPISLIPQGKEEFEAARLAEPLTTLSGAAACTAHKAACLTALQSVEEEIAAARAAALSLEWKKAAEALIQAERSISAWYVGGAPSPAQFQVDDPLLEELSDVEERIQRALVLTLGIQLASEADRGELVVGETFRLTTKVRCRPEVRCKFGELHLYLPDGMSELQREGDGEKGYGVTIQVARTPKLRFLRSDSTDSDGPFTDEWAQMQAEPPALVIVQQAVTVGGYKFHARAPALRIQATSTRVGRVPLRVVPAYTLAVEPKQAIEVLGKPRRPFDVLLRVHSYATAAAKVSVGLDVPKGWASSAPVMVEFAGAGDQYAKLTVTPPEKLAAGSYTIGAYAKRGEEKFATSLEPLPSMPTQLWEEPAECVVRALDIRVPEKLRVGYITAENEPIPQALERLGVLVEMMDAAALAFGDLSKYDAIVVGVRAYELRNDLAAANQRLLRYAEEGGTLVVQYERDFIWNSLKPAPYPAAIGQPNPRITDENAPVRFLLAEHPLLNFPNKITQEDFQGWVQERGLYFWKEFDARYQAVLGMHDPGESELDGGLVYAPYGKGSYIYTGLAFFRQLPEGVPGAYRLFVNLMSQSKMNPAKH